ncbi:MAG TPA: elongation factor Ts [Candidatus Paceibacterota bacterium]
MQITTDLVKELRDLTGISVMQCKKALEEADGNKEKALVLLRKKGASVAAKKADRELKAGTVASYVHAGGTIGAMVVLSCETDFVSGNEEFKTLARDLAMQVAATAPEYASLEAIPEEAKQAAREVFEKEVKDKPKEMQGKILEGKLASYFKEKTLLDQPFIKDGERTVRDLVEGAIQKFGEKIAVANFVRVSL